MYLWWSPVPVLNHIASKVVRFSDTLIWRYHPNISVRQNNDCPAQTNIIAKELEIRKHFYVSFFVISIKISSFTTLACYTICCTVKICQIKDLRGGKNGRQCFFYFSKRLKKRLWHSCFPVNFAKLFSVAFLSSSSGGCIRMMRLFDFIYFD